MPPGSTPPTPSPGSAPSAPTAHSHPPSPPRTLIIGAGLGGSLLAHYLGARGIPVQVVERRPDPRARGSLGGRSINLAISARGFHALDRGGLGDAMRAVSTRMPGRMIHTPDGHTHFQPYSRLPDRAIHSVSRSALNMLLIRAAAAHPSVTFRFDQRCLDVDLTRTPRPAARFQGPDGSTMELDADLIVGADGAYSAVRSAMQRNERFDYRQEYLRHGYKELTIPPADASGRFAMEPHALHIWPRGSSMMIALPNPEGNFTCTLFWPFTAAPGQPSFSAIRTGEECRAYFERHYPDAPPLMPDLQQEFERNPVGTMVTVRCFPWSWAGRTALLGDAAHAVVPFYGQGANASFEDCECLVDCLETHHMDVPAALADYQDRRKRNADAIADMALANFVEMRDRTASRAFRWRKKLEHALHGMMPSTFVPLYDMVSFSTIPYADARERARRQDRALLGAGVTAAAVAAAGAIAGAAYLLS